MQRKHQTLNELAWLLSRDNSNNATKKRLLHRLEAILSFTSCCAVLQYHPSSQCTRVVWTNMRPQEKAFTQRFHRRDSSRLTVESTPACDNNRVPVRWFCLVDTNASPQHQQMVLVLPFFLVTNRTHSLLLLAITPSVKLSHPV